MHDKAQSQRTIAPRRAISATPAPPRTPLARLAARLPEPSAAIRTAGIRPVAAKAVGSFVPRLTRSAFEKYGFSAASLITDWAVIVGDDIARYTVPERLKWPRHVEMTGDAAADSDRGRPGATLVLGVADGRALDMQYKSRQLVERINAYFGYAAIADLRIVQIAAKPTEPGQPAVLPQPPAASGNRQPPPVAELAAIADPSLRAALERMAAGLVSRNGRRPAAG